MTTQQGDLREVDIGGDSPTTAALKDANENACSKYFAATFKMLMDQLFATETDPNECDPYVKITLESGGSKKISRQTQAVLGGGRNVKFSDSDDRILEFPINAGVKLEEVKLKISVYDEDLGADDKIGGLETTVRQIRDKMIAKLVESAEENGEVPPPPAEDGTPLETTIKITDPTQMFAGNVHCIISLIEKSGTPTLRIELIGCHGLKTSRLNDQHADASILNFLKTMVYFAAYILAVGALFKYVEPDTFVEYGDACWFAVVSMSTVGYGDYYPITPAGRYLNCLMILIGSYVFALIFGRILTFFVARRDKKKRKASSRAMVGGPMLGAARAARGGHHIRGKHQESHMERIIVMLVVFLVLMIGGGIFFKYYEPSQEDGEASFEETDIAIHFLFVTVSTVGYGDVSPGSFLGRFFGSLFIILGVTLLAELTSLWIEHFELQKQKKLRRVVMEQSLTSMDEFEYFDQDGESDGKIEKHEFLGKMLTKIDACDYALVEDIMNRFAELDVDCSGYLDKHDFLERGGG